VACPPAVTDGAPEPVLAGELVAAPGGRDTGAAPVGGWLPRTAVVPNSVTAVSVDVLLKETPPLTRPAVLLLPRVPPALDGSASPLA